MSTNATNAKGERNGQEQEEPVDSKDNIQKVAQICHGCSGSGTTSTLARKPDTRERIVLRFYGNKEEWGYMRDQKISVIKDASLFYYFDQYAENLYNGITRYSLRFLFDGKRLEGERSAASYELEDGDQIDVFEAMTGGGS